MMVSLLSRMGDNGVGAEVVKVNIVYFLSRDGKVEHPHLIRGYHQRRRHGVRLRDVKRWLSDQRGKEMPENFAWSYKRRYKTGYVWQDLKDDDLITPISDCEYVLKGSWIPCCNGATAKSGKEKGPSTEEGKVARLKLHTPPPEALQTESDDSEGAISPRPPPLLDQDSSDERSAVFKIDMQRQQVAERKEERVAVGESRSSTSGRASNVLRSIITCGLVETNDAALRRVDRSQRDQPTAGRGGGDGGHGAGSGLQLQRRHYADSYSRTKPTSNGKSSTKTGDKVVPAIYRPTTTPNCSQCGKCFRPEKLHSHMKACKGLKERLNGGGLKRMPTRAEPCSQQYSKDSTKSGLISH